MVKKAYKYLIELLEESDDWLIIYSTERFSVGIKRLVEAGLIKLSKTSEGEYLPHDALPWDEYKKTDKFKKLVRDVYAVFENYLK